MQHRPLRWLGWAISILIFIFIIVFTSPPSHDVSIARSKRGNDKETTKLSDRDILVKCELVSPFDIDNHSAAKGILNISVHQSLAPLASGAFLDMVNAKHFDGNYIFRVVKDFIVQWGIESPSSNKSKTKFPKVDIDPPPSSNAGESTLRSNVRGALNFAGGNSGSGQVYINRKQNPHLDKEKGSLPFATLDEASMQIIDAVYSYKEGSGQVKAVNKGDDEVKRLFPRMSRIERCWIADEA